MSKAKITLIGFYNYMDVIGDDLFKNLNVPSGIDKTKLINNILLKGGEFEVLYAEPFFYQTMIGVWSDKWQRTMKKWIDALSIDYNPLENYDRMEEWLDNNSRISSNNSSETINRSENTNRTEGASANDYSVSTGNGTTENERSAYDVSTYSKHDKSTSDTSGENTSSSATSAYGNTDTSGSQTNEIDANSVDSSQNTRTGRAHGNIGVTTSQQMLESELEIARFNIYDEIADLFISELCIYLY